jgi:hypothetical protein
MVAMRRCSAPAKEDTRNVPTPTIASRLQRRFIVITADDTLVARLRARVPEGWSMVQTSDLNEIGGFQDVLQHRFILLDLDAGSAFDPLAVLRQVRGEMMLNIAIFCFGGTAAVRDAARLARGDRFFDRDEVGEKLASFCEQFGW